MHGFYIHNQFVTILQSVCPSVCLFVLSVCLSICAVCLSVLSHLALWLCNATNLLPVSDVTDPLCLVHGLSDLTLD